MSTDFEPGVVKVRYAKSIACIVGKTVGLSGLAKKIAVEFTIGIYIVVDDGGVITSWQVGEGQAGALQVYG